MSKKNVVKMRVDPVERLIAFEDSREVARGILSEGGRYWEAEASTHILGLWKLARELAAEVRRLRRAQ